MKRTTILAASLVMQMCLGATYSWSVYVQPLRAMTGVLQGTAQLPFSIFYLAFPATMVLSGTLLARLGPRRCAVSGGLAFGGGWLLASLGDAHFGFTVAGIGLLAGIGVGFAYIVPVATCIRWFPEHKGLVTGVAVAGFGGGAALVSQGAGHLMHARGATPFETFALFGAVFLVLVTLAGLVMENPPEEPVRGTGALPLARILREPRFWPLYAAMFTGLAAGFTVNANLKELHAGGGVQVGVAAVSLFAVANALGRVTWGWAFDRVRSTRAIRTNLAAQAAVLLSGAFLLRSPGGLLAFALLAGFNYGGVLVLYASTAARIWGAPHVGQVYGWLFSANIPAALAPLVAGYVFDVTGGFALSLGAVALLLLAALPWVKA